MKFPRNRVFDQKLDSVNGLIWYPYIGEFFTESPSRIMVYAHNIPVPEKDYESLMKKWESKSYWADCIEEYTYCQGWWTKTFRAFVKGAVGLSENYNSESSSEIIKKVDDFIGKISYLNFIQDSVKSENQLANATSDQILKSQKINQHVLDILEITHCICWGKQVYQHILAMDGNKIIKEEKLRLRGFSRATIQLKAGRIIKILKVFHPSMPSFKPYSEETQKTLSEFIEN